MDKMTIFNNKPKEPIALPPAPIQDENGNLTFSIEGTTYSLNVNYKEERERVKEEINVNSLTKYDWFKEETGKKHWVFYDTSMYMPKENILNCLDLHYGPKCKQAPIIPINATSCHSMFSFFPRLKQLDLSNFNTNNIIDMYSMFDGCESLTQLDLSNFDTSHVTDMSGMFYCCESLTQLDLSDFDTSSVINMNSMFKWCKSLTRLDLSNFNTSQVTNMFSMFYNCKSLIQLNLSNFDTSQVTRMDEMFYCCSSLVELDLNSFNVSNTVNMIDIFGFCKKLVNIYISDKWKTNSVKDSDDMFNGCRSLPGFSPEKTDIEMAKSVEQDGYLTLKK